MKYILFSMIVVCFVNGCNKNENSVEPTTDPTLSTSIVVGRTKFTLSTPKAIFGFHDTLSAGITAYNQSDQPDTILFGNTAGMWSYSLKNDSGKIVIDGPHAFSNIVGREILKPEESFLVSWVKLGEVGSIIGDSASLGNYTLQMGLYNNSILLSLNLIFR